MKQRILQLALLITVMILARCSEDEKPKTLPEVTTTAITDFTTTTATVGGEITDDGNAEITETGFVYSSAVSIPTIADDKIELTDTDGEFSTMLEDLTSGTTYHVRAYAVNSKGIGYGLVEDFETGNAAPVAMNVSVTGAVEVNGQLTGTYTYTDSEGDAQAISTFQWYVADNATGTGEVVIAGATELTYTIQAAQQSKYIRFGVTPKAGTGNLTGTEVKSSFIGGVGEATTVTFTYNGVLVTYGIINSGTTGRKWLDRNLGAPNVPAASNDFANYGDLFQWGRRPDGHQLTVRTGGANGNVSSINGTTSTVEPFQFSSTDTPPHALYIVAGGEFPTDWRNPQNDNLWQGVDGINNPCPSGWRIPTEAEWMGENLGDIADAFAKLKITLSGVRAGDNGNYFLTSTNGQYWSSTANSEVPEFNTGISFFIDSPSTTSWAPRANGYPCKCIKD